MIGIRNIVIAIWGVVLAAPVLSAQDFSRYREFQMGDRLAVIVKQLRMKTTEVKTIHHRPAVIQELEWQALYPGATHEADSVRSILFSFYNGQLSRLVVTYDRERTAGLTTEDFIEAISAKYGAAARPTADITLASTYLSHQGGKVITERTEKVLARWEDAQYSYNLFQPYSAGAFGLAIYVKRLEALAQAAIIESNRLDEQEAPQRERERIRINEAAVIAEQEKARRANKGVFRP